MSLQCPSKNEPKNGKFADVRGTLHKSTKHKEKPANPDISRVYELLRSGAGGRTRTGTVSPPVDFESTTSANSITPAFFTVYSGCPNRKQSFRNSARILYNIHLKNASPFLQKIIFSAYFYVRKALKNEKALRNNQILSCSITLCRKYGRRHHPNQE